MPAAPTTMLNIGRMAPGSHDYYLSVVADGAEDYYLARGEAPGRWLGQGIDQVNLEGQVEALQLRRVLAGDHPHTGERLAAHPARKVPGFDLTFRAPKSVSLLWAFSDRDVADQVLEAHEAAVTAAVGYLEREAARTRRGAGGTERVEVDGLIAAAFPHRTSRAGDPLLHTHVLVANLVRTADDGRWRTLESRRLFLHAKTAGYLYQTHLRRELSARLGVAWQPVVNGHADLAGIDRPLIDLFSQRRQAIEAQLAKRGESSAKAAQVATLTTRTAKERQATEPELRHQWAAQARAAGFDQAAVARVVGRHRPSGPDLDRLVDELVSQQGLTQQAATFARRDLLRSVAERLADGACVEEVERLADAILERSRGEVVQLWPRRGQLAAVDTIRGADGRIIAGEEHEPRMTTRRLLLAEQHAIDSAIARRREGVGNVPRQVVDQVLGNRPTMTGEQQTMVRRLTSDGDGVTVVLGRAGTGKTFSLDAARAAWHAAGIRVHGVALAARAARELQDSAGIPSTSIHRLLSQIDDPQLGSPLQPGSVLVVDEAGMVGTRHLARLLAHAQRQRVKVVLVGDPRQLPEIDAGGLFGHLLGRLEPIRLTVNRRQTAAWEADALDQLRHGDPAAALHLYKRHGRVTTAATAEAVRDQLVSDWWDAHQQAGADRAVMVALRQTDVDDLNRRARTRLRDRRRLHGPVLDVGRQFQVGDRVLCLRNDRRLGVVNGTFATIERIDGRDLEIHDDHGQQLRLPGRYVGAGHVTHGYAITGHKAQGLTVDHTFVLGSDQLYREWGYVALSRGRSANRLYLHPAAIDLHGTGQTHPPTRDPEAQTVAQLRRSHAQTPAIAYVDEWEAAQVAARWRHLSKQLADIEHRRSTLAQAETELTGRRDALAREVERLEARGEQLGGMRRFHRTARDEVRSIDVQLEQHRADLHGVEMQWVEVRRERERLPAPSQLQELRSERAQFGGQLHAILGARVDAATRNPPAYVRTSIGARPDQGPARAPWLQAVRAIEHYRLAHSITDPQQPLGGQALDAEQRRERDRAMQAVLTVSRMQHQRQQAQTEGWDQTMRRVIGR